MELRQLRYFVTVAEELHFGRAARRLHMTQPPLSQQIRALEEDIRARLLERTSRSVALTEAGRAFLDRARDILAAADKAADTARAVASGARGRLAVGFVGPAVDGFLSGAIRAFRDGEPGIVLELSEMGSLAQVDALRAGRLHAGFVRAFGAGGGQAATDGLAVEILVRERYVVALPSDHALARRRSLRLADLGRIPLIMYPRRQGPALHDAVMDVLASAGARPVAAQEALSKHVAVALASAGLGAALVPESTARARRRGVAFRPIDDDPSGGLPMVEMAMIHDPAHVSPALERFMESARAAAADWPEKK